MQIVDGGQCYSDVEYHAKSGLLSSQKRCVRERLTLITVPVDQIRERNNFAFERLRVFACVDSARLRGLCVIRLARANCPYSVHRQCLSPLVDKYDACATEKLE